MNELVNWQGRLLQIAREHSEIDALVGRQLREVVSHHLNLELLRDVQLADSRAREAVVVKNRMSLRCGALLGKAKLTMTESDFTNFLKVSGISQKSAESYLLLALKNTELSKQCLKRKYKLTLAEKNYLIKDEI